MKGKVKTKTQTNSSKSRESCPAQDAKNRRKPAGCICDRPEATGTYTVDHVGNTKGAPTIDVSVTSYGGNVRFTESFPSASHRKRSG